MKNLISLWFGFKTPVNRRNYAMTGVLLAFVKFAGDFALVHLFTDETWTPLSYLNPYFIEQVVQSTHASSEVFAMVAWTIPFLWIGASMTFRRVIDAGLPAPIGLLFFVPFLNYLTMLLLCLLPSQTEMSESGIASAVEHTAEPDLPSAPEEAPQEVDPNDYVILNPDGGLDNIFGAAVGVAAGAVCMYFAVGMGVYGGALFLGTPFIVGAITAFVMNHRVLHSIGHTTLVVQLALIVSMIGMLIFAFEGMICLVMAYPLVAVIAGIGGVVGHELGQLTATRLAHFWLMFLAVPVLTGIESYEQSPPIRTIVTTIEVNAPASVVWDNVISFPPLPPAKELIFRLGVACPESASIDGEGEGALRYCVFTTGTFVEPITVWDPPNRLAFDVIEQPPNMNELSPYDSVHPDHLLEGVVSHNGEFRLIELEDGRTLLKGTTYYSLNFTPQFYWGWWSDHMIHTIHYRVLNHIKGLSEENMNVAKK